MQKLGDEDNDELARLQTLLQIHFIEKLVQNQEVINYLTIPNSKKHCLNMYIDIFLLTTPHIEQLELIQVGIKAALNSTSIS